MNRRCAPFGRKIRTCRPQPRRRSLPPARRALRLALLGAPVLLGGVLLLSLRVDLDELELGAELDRAALDELRERCRADAQRCDDLGRVYLRAWAERQIRGNREPLTVTVEEDQPAGFLYRRACEGGDQAACAVADALQWASFQPRAQAACPTQRIHVADEAGQPLFGLRARSTCYVEGQPPTQLESLTDLDGYVEIIGYKVELATHELDVAPELVLPTSFWNVESNGAKMSLPLGPEERAKNPHALPLRGDPPLTEGAGQLDGWWFRQPDPIADQAREPLVRLALPGATGGVSWPDPPPRLLHIADAGVRTDGETRPLAVDGGVAVLRVGSRASLLVAIGPDALVVLDWAPTGFDEPYLYARPG